MKEKRRVHVVSPHWLSANEILFLEHPSLPNYIPVPAGHVFCFILQIDNNNYLTQKVTSI